VPSKLATKVFSPREAHQQAIDTARSLEAKAAATKALEGATKAQDEEAARYVSQLEAHHQSEVKWGNQLTESILKGGAPAGLSLSILGKYAYNVKTLEVALMSRLNRDRFGSLSEAERQKELDRQAAALRMAAAHKKLQAAEAEKAAKAAEAQQGK